MKKPPTSNHKWSFAKKKIKQEILNPIALLMAVVAILINIIMPGKLILKIFMAIILIVPQIALTIINYPLPKKFSQYIALKVIKFLTLTLSIRYMSRLDGFLSVNQVIIMIMAVMIGFIHDYWWSNKNKQRFIESKKIDLENGIVFINIPWLPSMRSNQQVSIIITAILVPVASIFIHLYRSLEFFTFIISLCLPFLEYVSGMLLGRLVWIWNLEKQIKKHMLVGIVD